MAIALTLPRIAAAFLILPLLTQETVPALVRNSLFMVLAIVIFPLTVTAATAASLDPFDWPFILLKEMFLGIVIGLLFGSVFWALGVAGGFVDTQAGTNMAATIDPLQGHQSTPTSQWLSRFASWLFMASGGFLIFLDVLLSSYRLWPVHQALPNLQLSGITPFVSEFNYIMTIALMMAAPAILLMALVDLALGLVNRFAQQINVQAIAMPVKSWVATWMMLISLGLIVEIVLRKLFENRELLVLLKQAF